ncbi:MAG: alpha-N-arabinofuranosidase [Cyclobacteriaceae bacterium]|nr:alpha-N-arabinofuranosidase [Cyclobacteriaceae bacterium]MCX7636572.1 alpha-N-arabinofuranosidase [Cyclobacteriaceae bacterium]MDW8330586.1 alpha-L-arabinofuranosidase C-terminal domain-containing protein [Cyclobacteriaceae bacterium]
MKKLLALFFLTPAFAFSQNLITIRTHEGRDTISRHIYGHFAEHLGRCIYEGLYVGEGNTSIPNKNGIRLDVVEALKKLKVPVLRWPGGCFADAYHWRDGIGPKSQRRHTENVWWGNVREDNSFGTHEFLELCEMLGAEPYLAVNVGSGTVQEAAEWVQYVNHKNGTSALTDLRRQNGRDNPWKVQYWGIGNESWGCGGNMTVEYYVNLYRQFATFMTSYSNSEKLFRIAVGPGTEDYHWTEVLMRDIPRNMIDGVSIHHYSVINWRNKGSATRFSGQEYYSTIREALRVDKIITRHKAVMDKYDPQKKVALIVDEWGTWYNVEPGTNGAFLYQQNTLRDAVVAGLSLNIFNQHCDRVKMANLAQMVNVLQAVILTEREKMLLTPTYHVMEMYTVHHDALLLPIVKKVNQRILAGDTLSVISASASRKNNTVSISLVNIDLEETQKVNITLEGMPIKKISGRILKSDAVQDHNTFARPDKVKPAAFSDFKFNGNTLETALPPFSVVVLQIN